MTEDGGRRTDDGGRFGSHFFCTKSFGGVRTFRLREWLALRYFMEEALSILKHMLDCRLALCERCLRFTVESHPNMLKMLISCNNICNPDFFHNHHGSEIGERYPGFIIKFQT